MRGGKTAGCRNSQQPGGFVAKVFDAADGFIEIADERLRCRIQFGSCVSQCDFPGAPQDELSVDLLLEAAQIFANQRF
ncbi:hypothetical protein WS68_23535 [Burkholderia sp. TSV86]|nr:hypothetical protein WS68_23535 [Burkholderia sp. TSV86]